MKIIIAITISPKGTINTLKNEDIDQIEVIISMQNSNFVSIEPYYNNFNQVKDN